MTIIMLCFTTSRHRGREGGGGGGGGNEVMMIPCSHAQTSKDEAESVQADKRRAQISERLGYNAGENMTVGEC